jgi:GNAT superfamily N-acetyltransferase
MPAASIDKKVLMRSLDLSAPTLSEDARQRLCWLFYNAIYRQAFPVADETEDPTIWLPLMTATVPPTKPQVHLVLAVTGNGNALDADASSILGGIIYEYYRSSKAALITYLCIAPNMRGKGVARFLVGQAIDDVRRANGPLPVFAEAEDPALLQSVVDGRLADTRLSVLSHLGFREIPIRYRQPALGPAKRPVENLKFLLFTAGRPASIDLSRLVEFMHEFYFSLNAQLDERRMFGGIRGKKIMTIPLGKNR